MVRRHTGTVKSFLLLCPGGKRELGLECENSTINLITRAVAPAPVSGAFWWDGTS